MASADNENTGVKKALGKYTWSDALAIGKQLLKFAVVAAGILWGTLAYYLGPYVEDKIQANERKIEERDKNKKSFRSELGEFWDLPAEAVPYELNLRLVKVDCLITKTKEFQAKYQSYLDEQMSRTLLIRYLDDQGQEFFTWRDGRPHPVVEYDNGCPWIVYSNRKIYPLPCK